MKLTQGTFSFLPDLSDDQIRGQIEYCLEKKWAVSIEHTDDPHPRNTYWDMYGLPMFDLHDAAGIMQELESCRKTFPERYIKINAFDSSRRWEALRLSFIVNRPSEEPGFGLIRTETTGRRLQYTTRSYAADRPAGKRY